MVTVIYIDVLLALNLFIDFLLLAATARLLHCPCRRLRLICGAVAGSLSSLLILLPPLSTLLSLVCKLGCAVIMIRITFRWNGMALYIKQTLLLFFISALFAGICAVCWYTLAPNGFFVQSGIVYYDVPPLLLTLLTLISYGILCLYDRLMQKRVRANCAYRLSLPSASGNIVLRCLLDTGLTLCDGFSGTPVIVVSRKAVLSALSPAMIQATAHPKEPLTGVRYIPFSSLGGMGLLPAFRPHKAVLSGNGSHCSLDGVWIAVADTLGRGEYEALISPDVAALLHKDRAAPFAAVHPIPTHSERR